MSYFLPKSTGCGGRQMTPGEHPRDNAPQARGNAHEFRAIAREGDPGGLPAGRSRNPALVLTNPERGASLPGESLQGESPSGESPSGESPSGERATGGRDRARGNPSGIGRTGSGAVGAREARGCAP
jgi:hypothetical protein